MQYRTEAIERFERVVAKTLQELAALPPTQLSRIDLTTDSADDIRVFDPQRSSGSPKDGSHR